MIELVPLCTMTLTLREPVDAGNAPTGQRIIAEIASASLSGRLAGSLTGGGSADWLTRTPSGLGLPMCVSPSEPPMTPLCACATQGGFSWCPARPPAL